MEQQLGQDIQGRRHLGKVDWGVLAPAEIGKRPDSVSGHGQAVSIGQDGQQGRQDTLGQHEVPQVCRVASNVAKSPNGLEVKMMSITWHFRVFFGTFSARPNTCPKI